MGKASLVLLALLAGCGGIERQEAGVTVFYCIGFCARITTAERIDIVETIAYKEKTAGDDETPTATQ
jgi:hypothetical protein